MICGVVPFAEGVEDPYEVYHAILGKSQVYYPPVFNKLTHRFAKNFIQKLLSYNPEERFPRNGFKGLKDHEFYNDFDFDDFETKEMQAPSKDWKDLRNEEECLALKIATIKLIDNTKNQLKNGNRAQLEGIYEIDEDNEEKSDTSSKSSVSINSSVYKPAKVSSHFLLILASKMKNRLKM